MYEDGVAENIIVQLYRLGDCKRSDPDKTQESPDARIKEIKESQEPPPLLSARN